MSTPTSNRRMHLPGIASLVLAAAVSPAIYAGDPVGPMLDLTIEVNGGISTWSTQIQGTHIGGGTYVYDFDHQSDDWAVGVNNTLANQDPFVDANIAFTNNSAITNLYTITVVLPVAPAIVGGTIMGGSVGGSVTDSNNSGFAQVVSGSGPGSWLYMGFVDGVSPLGAQMYAHPLAFTVASPGQTTNIPANSFGLPGLTSVGPAAINTEIAIQLQFTLTPGDSVAITSFFIVEPVPAPAGLALLGMAGLLGSRRRRR